MSGIPFNEELISTVIQNGIKYLQQNPNIVDSLFSGTSLINRERLKSYLANNTPQISRNWPITGAKLPLFVVILGTDDENQDFLGSFAGDDEGNTTSASQTDTGVQIMTIGDSYILKSSIVPLVDVTSVVYKGVTYTNNFSILDAEQGLIQLGFPVDLTQADTANVTYDYLSVGNESYGAFFNSTYRIEVWTNNGDLTLLLYYVLKWIFISARPQLITNGLPIQKMSGGDLEPLPDYLPEFVWRRALVLSCTSENSYDVQYNFIQGISITENIQ